MVSRTIGLHWRVRARQCQAAALIALVPLFAGCAKQPSEEMKAAVVLQPSPKPPASDAPASTPADPELLPSDPMANAPPMPVALLKAKKAAELAYAHEQQNLAIPLTTASPSEPRFPKPRLPKQGVAFRGSVDDSPTAAKPSAFFATTNPTWTPVDVLVTDDSLPEDVIAIVQEAEPYLLDTGDRVRIFVYGQPNLSRTYPIDVSGTISMPLIGAVKARGLTVGKLKARIVALLGAKFVRDPEVAVEVSQFRPFYILGEVRNAGQYLWASGLTVQSAVAIAGGFSPRASERSVRLTRLIEGVQSEIDVPLSYPVKPGDTIYVKERFF